MLSIRARDRVAAVISVFLLAGAAADRLSVAPPADPEPFHARIHEVADRVPKLIGDWSAVDTPNPDAQAYLGANVYLNRMMTNVVTGQVVSLLIIQSKDARDLIPHFPAVCYPGRGMNQVDVQPKDWNVGDVTIHGSEYLFESSSFRQANALVVDNFMVLPNGEVCRDMKEVKAKLPIRYRFFGLGQVQVVFAAGTPEQRRDSAVCELLAGHAELILRHAIGGTTMTGEQLTEDPAEPTSFVDCAGDLSTAPAVGTKVSAGDELPAGWPCAVAEPDQIPRYTYSRCASTGRLLSVRGGHRAPNLKVAAPQAGMSPMSRSSSNQQTVVVERSVDVDPPEHDAQYGQKESELAKIHRLLRGKYRWAVLLSIVLGGAGVIGGVRLGTKTYQSAGIIRVMPVVPKIMYSVDEKGQLPAFDAFVDAQVALIRSQRVLTKALEDPSWTSPNVSKSDQVMAAFTKTLDVSRQGDMIFVKATHGDPQTAMISVDAVIAAYKNVYDELEARSDDKRRQLREDYRTKLANEWGNVRQRIHEIATVYGSDDLKPQFDFKMDELNKLEVKIGDLQRMLPLVASQANNAAAKPVHEITAEELAAMDGQMGQLVTQQSVAERRLKLLQKHGILQDNNQIKAAEAEAQEAADAVDNYLHKYKVLHPGGVADAGGLNEAEIRSRLKSFQDIYDKNKADLTKLGQQVLEISELRAREAEVKAQLDDTTHMIEQMDLESQSAGRISIMSKADTPLAPFRDTRPTYAAAAAMGGIVIGFGSMMLLGLVRRTLERPEDARPHVVGLPMLGVLPHLPENLADPEQAAIAAHAVHQIRTLLQITGRGSHNQVYAVTSPVAGTGKTTLALSLGVSFAAANLNTLLIDCDLVGGGLTERINVIIRRKIGQILRAQGLISDEQLNEALTFAQQHRRRLGEVLLEMGCLSEADLYQAISDQTEAAERVGVLDALSGDDLVECVTETGVKHLSVLPLGDASPQHAGRLSPSSIRRVIETARRHFDIVLIDTGPIPGSLEASIVTSQADAVILTVSRGEQAALLEASIGHLVSVGAKIAGLVFNRAKSQDVIRYGSSAGSLAASSRASSGNRAAPEFVELPAEADRLGPVALAVAASAPATRPVDGSRS